MAVASLSAWQEPAVLCFCCNSLHHRSSRAPLPCYGRVSLKRSLIELLNRPPASARFSHRRMIAASFNFQAQTQVLVELGQSLLNLIQNGVSLVSQQEVMKNQSESLFNKLSGLPSLPREAALAAIAAGATVYVARILPQKETRRRVGRDDQDMAQPRAKEWVLIMSSSPFNRFVLMRCPSIVFNEADVYEGLAQKLTKEGRHFVSLENENEKWGGALLSVAPGVTELSTESNGKEHITSSPVYQRACIHTADGGVLAIDWPSHLDLSGEHGLDTTFLLIPGSEEGSGNKEVRSFVRRSLRSGYFPIVVNPRGCASSPLTTPRLFTAGDSDDIRTAVDFVLRSRPWASIMAIGWGYGANMLVKYLGEEEASTPLTAAVCIGNPFDLEESTKSSWSNTGPSYDEGIKNGFVKILKSNQLVFEGKNKGFDVKKGLSARSVREFDEVISRVANGFDTLEGFYKNSSSKLWLDKVRIPLLCIQDHGSNAKSFSVPRHVFEESPFTTLILCLAPGTHKPKDDASSTSMEGYDEALIVEWLAGVELAFLKGRHPLVQSIDLTFKPSKERSLPSKPSRPQNWESQETKRNPSVGIRKHDKFGGPETMDWEFWDTDQSSSQQIRKGDKDTLYKPPEDINWVEKRSVPAQIGGPDQSEDCDSNIDKVSEIENKENSDENSGGDEEVERIKARQAAESVMNVLDITMPGTLPDDKKKEVLTAVERGETIVSALQEACPEEVREKMITAVSAAVQARGISLKLAGFGKSVPAPKIPEGMVEKIQDKLQVLVPNNQSTPVTAGEHEPQVSDKTSEPNSSPNFQTEATVQKSPAKDQTQGSVNVKKSESTESTDTNLGGQNGAPTSTDTVKSLQTENQPNQPQSQTQSTQNVNSLERQNGSGFAKPADNSSSVTINQEDKSLGLENHNNYSTDQEPKPNVQSQKQDNSEAEGQAKEVSTAVTNSEKKAEVASPAVSGQEDQNRGAAGAEASPLLQTSSPSLDMSRAFEALTGVDDSTQMAVTNVFGVIENVLEQLEKEQNQHDQQSEKSSVDENSVKGESEQNPEREIPSHGEKHESQNEIQKIDTGSQQSGHCSSSENIMSTNDASGKAENLHECMGNMQSGKANSSEDQSTEFGTEDKLLEEKSVATGGVTDLNYNQDLPQSESERNMSSESEGDIDHIDVALEYFEDEQIWKFTKNAMPSRTHSDVYERRKKNGKAISGGENEASSGEKQMFGLAEVMENELTQVVEPAYVILDEDLRNPGTHKVLASTAKKQSYNPGFKGEMVTENDRKTEALLKDTVFECISEALELELTRRLGETGIEALGSEWNDEIESIAVAVATVTASGISRETGCNEKASQEFSEDLRTCERGILPETIVDVINRAYSDTSILSRLIPAGVVVGVILAAISPLSLVNADAKCQKINQVDNKESYDREYLLHGYNADKLFNPRRGPLPIQQMKKSDLCYHDQKMRRKIPSRKVNLLPTAPDTPEKANTLSESEDAGHPSSNRMVDLMAAAMGATSVLASQTLDDIELTSAEHDNGRLSHESNSERTNLSVEMDENKAENDSKTSIVSSLTEKAMSVAAPVVPTKKDGGIDHERLVAILAGLGQKGGILRYVGKVALLWGGLRGAMSLTDRLLVFLHISDRPLHQRLLAFSVMALLLWSPVLVPLIPSLLQQWASRSRGGVASTAATVGFYGAVVILVTLWGKKIRGYESPLSQYGLIIQPNLGSAQILLLSTGLTMGLSLVAVFYTIGISFGLLHFTWATSLCFHASKTALSNMMSCWKIGKLALQCIGTSLAISTIEELFFRSWLHEEIAADLGFHRAAILSGLVFSIAHWSFSSIPGLWLLSLALTGAKFRCGGDLMLAIGINAGFFGGNQIIKYLVHLSYAPDAPTWFLGTQAGNPFSGFLGVYVVGLMAMLLYPWDKTLRASPSQEDVGM